MSRRKSKENEGEKKNIILLKCALRKCMRVCGFAYIMNVVKIRVSRVA